MDQETSNANVAPPAPVPSAPPPETPLMAEQPLARLFGVPVIIWVLILFVIVIGILSWFDLVGGDIL